MQQAPRVLRHLFVLTLASFFLLAAMCTRPVEPAKPAVSRVIKDSATVSKDSAVGLPVFYTAFTAANVNYQYNPPAPGQQNLIVTGSGLYEADHTEFLFRNVKGDQYRITPTTYKPDGSAVTIDLPAAIRPSQYHVQLIRNGKLEPVFNRFLVQTPDRRQPLIVYIRDEQNNWLVVGDPEKPIPIRRGNKYDFNYVLNQWSKTVRIRLTSKTDDTKTYLIDTAQKDIDAYNLYGPGIGRPWFIVPASIPGGRYQLSLQFTDAKGNVFEGDPLERDIDLQ